MDSLLVVRATIFWEVMMESVNWQTIVRDLGAIEEGYDNHTFERM